MKKFLSILKWAVPLNVALALFVAVVTPAGVAHSFVNQIGTGIEQGMEVRHKLDTRPSLDLDFAGSRDLAEVDTRIAYSGGVNLTKFDASGVLGYPPHNLVLRSAAFDHASWINTSTTIVANSIANPVDGGTTADTVTHDDNASDMKQAVTSIASTVHTVSLHAKYIAGQWVRVVLGNSDFSDNIIAWFDIQNGVAGTTSTSGTGAISTSSITSLGDGWYRLSISGITDPTSTTYQSLYTNAAADGSSTESTDSNYWFGAQLNKGTLLPYTPTTTAAVWTAAFDHDPATLDALGLSVWEASTNTIRNNTMQGAAAGTPGTKPTNWAVSFASSTIELVETGIENGIEYIDYRFSGTPTSDGTIQFEAGTQIDALTTETWTLSGYVALIAGDLTNMTNIRWLVKERTELGALVKDNASAALSLTSTLQRLDYTVALSGGGTTAHVVPAISLNWDGSGAVDFTLRIGLPQMEKLAFSTPVIKTTTAAVTRTAVVPKMTDVSWFNQSKGTFQINGSQPSLTGTTAQVLQLDDGGSTDRILVTLAPSARPQFDTINSGGDNGASTGPNLLTTAPFKIIAAYASDDVIVGADGSLDLTPDAAADFPTADALTTFRIGTNHVSGAQFNGHLARIIFWPIRQHNGFLTYETAFLDEGSPIYASNDNLIWGIAA